MKISNILEILLILIIISFAASKPIDKESGRGVYRNHIKKGLIARQEPVPAVPAKPTVIEDDDDFDIADIFDVFDDDDDDEEESAEDESAEEADDDDEPEFDDSDSDEEVEEAETDAEGEGEDAFDLIADLLDDDDVTPKPKPSTAAPEVAQALDVTAGDDVVDDDDVEEEIVEAVKPQITIQKVTETKPAKTKATKAPKKPKPTSAARVPEKADLPPLNLQNTPALLELQAQLTANNVKGGDLSDEVAPPKPTKTQKKKKTSQKGQGKKQVAIITNEVSETTEEKTRLTEATKPQVIVENSVVMEKVPLKTPESEKLKKKQQVTEVEYFDEDEGAGEPEVIEVKS